MFNSKIR